jgi:hypothetical protein
MLNGMSFIKILKFFAGKLCTIIQEYLVRYAKTQYNALQKFDCILLVIRPIGSASTHFVKVSIATIKNL